MTPTGNNVLLELDKQESMVGSIFIPEKHRERAVTARVIAVGPGGKKGHNGKRVNIEIKPGDKVLTARYGGDDVEVNGRIQKLIDYEYIFGIVE